MNLPHLRKVQNLIRKQCKDKGLVFKAKTKSTFAYASTLGTKEILGFEFNDGLFGSIALCRGIYKVHIDARNTTNNESVNLAFQYLMESASLHNITTILFGLDGINEEFCNKHSLKNVSELDVNDKTGLETEIYQYYLNADKEFMLSFNNSFRDSILNYSQHNSMFDYKMVSGLGEKMNHYDSVDYLLLEECSYRNKYYDSVLTLYVKEEQYVLEDKLSSRKVTVSSPEELSHEIEEILELGLQEQRLINEIKPELKFLKEIVFYGKLHEDMFEIVKHHLLDVCDKESQEIEFAAKHKLFVRSSGKMTSSTPFMTFLHIVDKTFVLKRTGPGKIEFQTFDIPMDGVDYFLYKYSGDIERSQLVNHEKIKHYYEEQEKEIYKEYFAFLDRMNELSERM